MTDQEQREAARQFILKWRGYEKGETQLFWISLLQDVLGVSNAIDYIQFEKQVSVDGNTKFIDGYIPETRQRFYGAKKPVLSMFDGVSVIS